MAFGLLNGGLVTGIGLPPFIVTLGTMNIAYALTRIYTTSTITNLPKELTFLGDTFNVGGTSDRLRHGADAACCTRSPGSC